MNRTQNACFIEQLIQCLGKANVLTDSADKHHHLTENRQLYQGKALAVLRPETAQQVCDIVKACLEFSINITPQGGNTGLVGGQIPYSGTSVDEQLLGNEKNSVVLSLSRMNTIRQIDAVNGTISVDAGVILQSVQEAAAAAGCLFPLSLASEGSCQIGGNIASNAGGTAVLRYGNMRNLVLGLEVVLPNGRIWNGMRSLQKDNAGYDLKQLFIGSEGTLGIITGAVLKLYPGIQSRVTAFVGFDAPAAALELFQRVKNASGETLSAFELMPRFGLEIVVRHMQGVDPLEEPHPFYALIELSTALKYSRIETVIEQCLQTALQDKIIGNATIAQSDAQADALWKLREDMSWAQKYEGGSIKHDVSVPVSRTPAFINQATAQVEAVMPGVRVCAFGHMGDGNIHFNISQPVGMDKQLFLSHWEQFNRIVHDIVMAMDGSIAAEHGIGQLKVGELEHYTDEVSLDLMRKLKNALDPEGMMNKGKIVS